MTLKDLYSLLPLKAELEHERALKLKLMRESGSVVVTPTGMPHAHNPDSKVERYAIMIHDTGLRIQAIEARILEIESYIRGVDDELVRCVMKLKFIDGYTYAMIAARIGGGSTADTVRRRLYRYLSKKKIF